MRNHVFAFYFANNLIACICCLLLELTNVNEDNIKHKHGLALIKQLLLLSIFLSFRSSSSHLIRKVDFLYFRFWVSEIGLLPEYDSSYLLRPSHDASSCNFRFSPNASLPFLYITFNHFILSM